MELNRKIDVSVYYFVVDYLATVSSNITVTDGYPVGTDGSPEGELSLPTVAIERRPTIVEPYQLGGPSPTADYAYTFDIYAQNKVQRDDLAYLLQVYLDSNNIAVYNFDEGFPPPYPTRVGTLVITGNITNTPVYVFPNVVPKMYWRAVVDFNGYYNPT